MPYAKYIFKPGIDREGTDYSNEGGWYDANLVRFRKGRPEKIGGWQKATGNYYLGTGRALHGWVGSIWPGRIILDWEPLINTMWNSEVLLMI